MAGNNMYKVGDFVYFEASASNPFQVRRIEELNKTSSGAVEAKVVCLYRRRDIPENLIPLADKNLHEVISRCNVKLNDEDIQKLKHKELFLSRTLETLHANHIRGKCIVKLHDENEIPSNYLEKEDLFFFHLVYDPIHKTLQTDRSSIRMGAAHQATIPDRQKEYVPSKIGEELQWDPSNNISSDDFKTFNILVRSLATMGRANHTSSLVRQPSLSLAAASACRDCTLQLALNVLHKHEYNTFEAIKALCPGGRPVLKFDEMENWSAYDGNVFEEALEKYGKNFSDIQSDILHWKSVQNIVEFYYMWKTTDNYVQLKKIKAAAAEHKLKQVYIPNFSKPISSILYQPTSDMSKANIPCESCQKDNSCQWYALGPPGCILKVCNDCWSYWKRYGDLKKSSVIEKLGIATAKYVYKCNISGCNVNTDSKQELRVHLESVHSHGNALAIINSCIPTRMSYGVGININSNGEPIKPPDNFFYLHFDNTMINKIPASSLNFQLHAPLAWKIGRRLNDHLVKSIKRLRRKPFSKIVDKRYLTPAIETEIKLNIKSLKENEAKSLIQRITSTYRDLATPFLPGTLIAKPGRRLDQPNQKSKHLMKVIREIFRKNGLDPNLSSQLNKTLFTNLLMSSTNTLAYPPDSTFIKGLQMNVVASIPQKRTDNYESSDGPECKRMFIQKTNNGLVTPKKSQITKTQLFLATDKFKKQRRRHFQPPLLKKMSRHPCLALALQKRKEIIQAMANDQTD